MKIIFICGCLESGKDGVGDYTMRMAVELNKQGHETALIALSDRFVNNIVSALRHTDEISLPVLRFPQKFSTNTVVKKCKEFIHLHKPDWISLQYVAFSFQDKGLPFRFSKFIRQVTKGYKVHIMFHELWVGMNKEVSFKMRIWGFLQKKMITSFVYKVNPLIVQTQAKLYQQQLKKVSINAEILPLFSNIKVIGNEHMIKSKNHINLIIFGSIHPGAPIDDFAKEAAEYSISNNIQIIMKFVGRCGKEQEIWASVWRSYNMDAMVLGEQSEQKISIELSSASIGIANTPYELMEKSGSVAAMKEHNLPIICLSHSWSYDKIRNNEEDKTLFQYTIGNLPLLINKKPLPHKTNITVIARSFVDKLSFYN